MGTLRVFLVTRGDRDSTLQRLLSSGCDFTVVTHDKEAINNVFKMAETKRIKYVLTGHRSCLAGRNQILQMVKPSEWYLSLDDDLGDVTQVHPNYFPAIRLPVTKPPPKGFKSWREVYRYPISYRALIKSHVPNLIRKCEIVGTRLGGFATLENPWFRANRYSYVKNVTTAIHVCQRGSLTEMKGGEYAHDQWQSLYMLAHCGSVVVDKWIRAHHVAFADPKGGLGRLEDREKYLRASLNNIVKEFSGIVEHGKFPNLKYKTRSRETLKKWREENGYT